MPFDGQHVPEKARILMAALELLRRDGWCRKATNTHIGEHCIAGAIWHVTGQKDTPINTILAFGYEPAEIFGFNDAKNRAFEEIEHWFEFEIEKAMT